MCVRFLPDISGECREWFVSMFTETGQMFDIEVKGERRQPGRCPQKQWQKWVMAAKMISATVRFWKSLSFWNEEKKTSQKESEIRYYCDSFQLTVYTHPYLIGIQEHLADQKPRCVTGGNPKRGVPIGWSPPRTRVQKLDGFYISIIWSGFCFLRGYRFPDTNSRCGSSQGCTRLEDHRWTSHSAILCSGSVESIQL